MDEFLILLQAKLDEVKSKGNVNTDIDKMQSQLDKLKIQAEIDPKTIQNLANSIEKLVNQKIVISNIGIDTKTAVKTGQDYGKQFSQGVSQELKSNSLKLDTFKKSLANIGMGSKEIDAVANRISNLGVQIETLNQARSSGKKDILSVNIAGIDEYGQAIKLTQQYNIATGKLVNAIDAVSTAQKNIGNDTNSIKKAENVFADYTAKIEQFKSTNSNILSGLLDPLSDFESKLSGLKNGTTSIDDVINSYKNLNAEASKITSNLSAQFNKVDSAVRNITKGDEAIASLRADFKGLSNAPKEVNSELTKCEKLLLNVKNIESQEGRTVNWSAAYKKWEQSLDSLRAKISTLKKEQSNVASTQIFNTKDLDSQGKIYIQKVNNTIEKTKSELESKLRNAGYMDIQIKGVEDATGKIKSLTATVTDATGAFKQLNFERAKIQNNGKAQAGFVQTDDVKIIGNISSSIGKVQSNLSSLKTKWEEQGVLVGKFKTKVEQLESSLSSIGSKGELNSLKTQIQDLKSEASTIAQVNKIQLSIDNGYGASEYQNRINAVTASLEKYGVETQEAKNITASLQSTFDSMKGMSGQELVNQADKLEQEFKAVKVSVDQAKLSYDKLMQPASKEKISSTLLKVQKLLDNNTKVTENVKNEWQGYVNRLSSGSDIAVKEINDINIRLKQTESSMRSIGKLGLSWTDKLKQAWEKFGGWGFATGTMMTLYDQIRKIPKEVYEIDTAMTNLYKVTDETSSKYNQFLDSSSKSAHELGRSISSLIEQTANWAKLGFSLDDAEQLAKISSIYANVGEVSNDTAVSDLVTAMKAFNIEASDSITIVDSLNKLGNEFATDAASLGEGLSKSASALHLAGNDINETLAMLTGGTEITQNASEMGNALKVLSMRVRGMKGELEELGEEYENVESISKIQTQILNQTRGHVNIFDDNGNFKSTYEILKGIAEVYDHISQTDQAALLETIAGKQRGNQIAALIQAFQSGQIEKAYEASANAAGSAMQEQERWLESLEAKIQQFEVAFQSLSSTVLDSGLLKWFVDFGTDTVKVLDTVVDKFGSLGTIGLGAGLFTSIKNVGMA